MERKDGEQIAEDYHVKDSPEVKRRQAIQGMLSRSVQRLQTGELDAAAREAQAALKLDPNSVDATTMMAVVEDRRGRSKQAGELYKRAAELAPQQGMVQNNYGTWLCANGFAPESLVWFDRALRAPDYPTPAMALANAGNCALSSGQIERAERDLRQALSLDPSNATALGALAEVEFRHQRYLPARAFVERRLAAAPANASVLKLASQIEERLGDKAAASRYVQRLRAEFPDAVDVTTGGKAGP
ncbi:type IV pilus biogenesis/stability protein PilW [Pseudoxanthomonas putridarboris]|uniref:Type IV pilus biogenesis/stability protein PilW n=2 Tax=Pseudoxanthomonas putridarboris TaxID=752605 RepID=A0ABU9IZD8_9GAMM